MPPVPGQGVGKGLLLPCPHGLTPGCDGASALASARGGSRETGREAELRQERVLSPQQWRGGGTRGVLVPGGSRGEGSCCPGPHPSNAAPPGVCDSSRNQKGFRGDGKKGEATQKAGSGLGMAPVYVNGHNPPPTFL